MKQIIGLGCKRYRGKDTTADYIIQKFKNDSPWGKYSFATPLKDGVIQLFGLTRQQVEDPILKQVKDPFWNLSPRQIMQCYGSAMRESFGPDFWVKSLERYLKQPENKYTNFCIPDVRYKEEALKIHELGGLLVRVDRDIPFDVEVDTHQSEVDLDSFYEWDEILDNTGSHQYLYDQIDQMLWRRKIG